MYLHYSPSGNYAKPPASAGPVKKELCKFGASCTNADCTRWHPSPAAPPHFVGATPPFPAAAPAAGNGKAMSNQAAMAAAGAVGNAAGTAAAASCCIVA
jgi:hypothetical protein